MSEKRSEAASRSTKKETNLTPGEATLVEADPERGFNYPYYLTAPEEVNKQSREKSESNAVEARPILVEPHNVGQKVERFEKHIELARERIEEGYGRPIADALRAPYLIPVFPRPFENPVDWTHMIHMLCAKTMAIEDGPLKRVDLQLLRMVEDAQERLAAAGYRVHREFMLNGFSSQAAFVNRFAALHPDRVCSVTAGGINGLVILPKKRNEIRGFGEQDLNYPVGIANIEELTGRPFDLEAFQTVNQFLYMGEDDDKDALLYPDAWTDPELRAMAVFTYGEDIHEERFPYCQSAYEEFDVNAVFRIYKNTGHSPEPALEDVIEFHERSFNGEDFESIRADFGDNIS